MESLLKLNPPVDLKRARKIIRERSIDYLVVSTIQNFYYFTGYRPRIAAQVPMFAVIYANSNHAPAVIISSYHEPLFRRRSPHIQEIYSYPIWISVFERDDIIKGKGQILKGPKQFIFENIINMLCNVLEERGLYKGVVAIEDDLIKKPKVKSMLLRRFPKSRLLEAEAVLWEIRKVKTNKEIEALKLAAELGVRGIQAVVDSGVGSKSYYIS